MNNSKSSYIRTLLASNFHQISCNQEPAYMRCAFWRLDEFGRKCVYAFAFSGDKAMSADAIRAARLWASNLKAGLILVSDTASPSPETEGIALLTSVEFFAKLGGQLPSYLVLKPEFKDIVTASGKNEVPTGLSGVADTIFEEYVHAGLQFLLPARVIKYGQDRLFEPLPDGIVLGENGFNLIYDAKAAKDGYAVSSTTIRQCKDYVEQFGRRYGGSVGRISAFLVVSGSFQASKKVMQSRSDELRAECGVGLCFLTAQDLADIVALFISCPLFRSVIHWKHLVSKSQLTINQVETELNERRKDAVLHQ